MPWTYNQSTGELRRNGQLVGTGYAGAGTTAATGRNNPAMENVANAGPIPAGEWDIGTAFNSNNTGPNVVPLTPVGHNAHGRTAFQIHGNNAANNASQGCIVMGPTIRQQVIDSGDTILRVVAGTAAATPTPTPTPGPAAQ
jgi:hypothetical protein